MRPLRAQAKLAMTQQRGTLHVEGRSGLQVQEHRTRESEGSFVVGSLCGSERSILVLPTGLAWTGHVEFGESQQATAHNT